MKCPSLLSSLLASVVFLVAGAAPAFPQTSDQMQAAVPDSIEIHWKTEGFVDISNIQKMGFKSDGWTCTLRHTLRSLMLFFFPTKYPKSMQPFQVRILPELIWRSLASIPKR